MDTRSAVAHLPRALWALDLLFPWLFLKICTPYCRQLQWQSEGYKFGSKRLLNHVTCKVGQITRKCPPTKEGRQRLPQLISKYIIFSIRIPKVESNMNGVCYVAKNNECHLTTITKVYDNQCSTFFVWLTTYGIWHRRFQSNNCMELRLRTAFIWPSTSTCLYPSMAQCMQTQIACFWVGKKPLTRQLNKCIGWKNLGLVIHTICL